MDKLIAYYSWSGNTRRIAEIIHKIVRGDIIEIEPEIPYPTSYSLTLDKAKKEIGEGYKPPLRTTIEIERYDLIFVGSPNWWGRIAPPVASFLSRYDTSEKIVVPFCSHGGGGKQRMIENIKTLCPNSKILQEFVVYGSNGDDVENKVSEWLKKLKIE
ncbi:MAG: flavodoxin [Thermotogae bacterium]|jgi:flavodoxin|nr:flavodoxin [Thermotogota bacterium]